MSFLGAALTIAVTDPLDYSALQDVEFRTGKRVTPVVVTQTWLETLLSRRYQKPSSGRERPGTPRDLRHAPRERSDRRGGGGGRRTGSQPVRARQDQPPIVQLVNLILSDAAKAGASDVHIEPHETLLQVRQRVDGLLHDVLTIPHHLQDATISRLKIMSGMDIAERRKPQDGRSRLRFEGRRIDLRVSTMPTQFGEKIVIRLLNADRGDPADRPARAVGREPAAAASRSCRAPQGMILVTGPTGSGKTSTLYTALNSIKSSTNNIITLEDPIEMQIPGVNQMQINAKAGVTFASGLRSILRQDPERDSGRRDPRSGDGGHRARRRADRPSAPQHAAHQRRDGDHHAAVRPRHPAVPDGLVAPRHRRAAAGAAAVSGVRGAASRRAPRRSRRPAARRGCRPMRSGSPGAGATSAGSPGSRDASPSTRCWPSPTKCAT